MNAAQIAAEQEIRQRSKSGKVAFVLWLLLGGVGAHMFYVGRYGDALAVILAVWVGWVLHPLVPFVFMAISGLALVAYVADYNEKVRTEAYVRFNTQSPEQEEFL